LEAVLLSPKISVIIPAKNEAKSIGQLITRTKTNLAENQVEIIVVDDGSEDDTKSVAERNGAITITHSKTLGKGAAMKTGAKAAKGDILIFLDGDGAHMPEDIPEVLAPILQNKADLVVGSRDFRDSKTLGYYIPRRITNKLASFSTSVFVSVLLPFATSFKYPVKWIAVEDAECGFKAIRKEKWRRFNLLSQGFEIESEIIYEACKNRLIIENVPINCNWDCRVSRLSIFRDGLRTLKLLFSKLDIARREGKTTQSKKRSNLYR
jgi:glycosyltransferase involved in cell wall biosynthesis